MMTAPVPANAASSAKTCAKQYTDYVVDLTRRLPEPVPVLCRDWTMLCSEGNISAVVGEAKSKKTFLCSAMAAGMLSADGYLQFDPSQGGILWIDTEQAEAHVHAVVRRIHRMAGFDPAQNHERLWALALREEDPRARAELAFEAIQRLHPRLVVIDGISDLQYDTNDLRESEHIVTQLMALSARLHCHIVCVLHTNPNSDKARGHTGSALQRKAETVLYVRRREEVSVVEPQFCRNMPFGRFAFRIGAEALPEECAVPPSGAGLPAAVEVADLLREAGTPLERSVLTSRLAERESISRNAAKVRISRALQRGEIVATDAGTVIELP